MQPTWLLTIHSFFSSRPCNKDAARDVVAFAPSAARLEAALGGAAELLRREAAAGWPAATGLRRACPKWPNNRE